MGAEGPNLFGGHLVSLGHQQPLDAEDKVGGANQAAGTRGPALDRVSRVSSHHGSSTGWGARGTP